jgi:hypothetical protein
VLPYQLRLKAEALYLARRTSEALEAINEAENIVERSEERQWSADLYRLRGVFLAAMGVEETQTGASFQEAIRIAKEQKSVSLERRAQETYAKTAAKKQAGQQDLDSTYFFDDSLNVFERPSRRAIGKERTEVIGEVCVFSPPPDSGRSIIYVPQARSDSSLFRIIRDECREAGYTLIETLPLERQVTRLTHGEQRGQRSTEK